MVASWLRVARWTASAALASVIAPSACGGRVGVIEERAPSDASTPDAEPPTADASVGRPTLDAAVADAAEGGSADANVVDGTCGSSCDPPDAEQDASETSACTAGAPCEIDYFAMCDAGMGCTLICDCSEEGTVYCELGCP